jgi:uncharacterized protein YndB with AHSA1/START domain
MENIDASFILRPFTSKIWINARPEDLILGWTRTDLVTKWFVNQCEFLDVNGLACPNARPGGTYKWTWLDGSVDASQVLEVEPTRVLYNWYNNQGTIEITATPDQSGSMVQLTQKMSDKIEPQEVLMAQYGCKIGWTFFLANLKSVVEGGIDLREKSPDRTHVLNI